MKFGGPFDVCRTTSDLRLLLEYENFPIVNTIFAMLAASNRKISNAYACEGMFYSV